MSLYTLTKHQAGVIRRLLERESRVVDIMLTRRLAQLADTRGLTETEIACTKEAIKRHKARFTTIERALEEVKNPRVHRYNDD